MKTTKIAYQASEGGSIEMLDPNENKKKQYRQMVNK